MRRFLTAVLIGLFLSGLPLSAQERGTELRSRIDRVLKEETDRLRAELTDLALGELGPAPEGPAALITPDLLREHAGFLAGDDLEGRRSGFPGERKAAGYVAGVMERAGLKPAGDEGTFFQKFKVGGRDTQNCAGLLEGTDPELKKQIVVLGAHHDHVGAAGQPDSGRLGRGGDDRIWNGADDNASGVAAVLGVVRAFGEGGLRGRRSILFLTFSGEEQGLVGSKHYVNHPAAPIGDHVFMINLDMVGRNPGRAVEIEGMGSAAGGALRRIVEGAVEKTGLKAKLVDRKSFLLGDSDFSSFRDKGVPFVFFFSGFHADYHRPTDHADRLAYGNLARVSRTAFYILREVADAPERPVYSGRPSGRRLPGPARRLGATMEELGEKECAELRLGEGQGGLRIEAVHAGTAAEGAGLKAGDILLGVAGESLPREGGRDRLHEILSERVRPGREVPLFLLREGRAVTLKAKWPE